MNVAGDMVDRTAMPAGLEDIREPRPETPARMRRNLLPAPDVRRHGCAQVIKQPLDAETPPAGVPLEMNDVGHCLAKYNSAEAACVMFVDRVRIRLDRNPPGNRPSGRIAARPSVR